MTRRMDNAAVYRVTTDFAHWLVELKRLKNTYDGASRYEATLINLDHCDTYVGGFVYRFTGHYCGDLDEARWIVNKYEEQYKQDHNISQWIA